MPASVRSSSAGSASFSDVVQVNRPTGVVANDHLWAFHSNDSGTTGLGATGWTAYGTESTADTTLRVYRKVATGSEPLTYDFRQKDNADGVVLILAVSGAHPTISPNVALSSNGGPTSFTPSVTPAAAQHLEIRAVGRNPDEDTVSWTGPSGYTIRAKEQTSLGFASVVVASRQISSSAPSGEKVFTAAPAGDRESVGVTISLASAEVTPDTGPPPPAFTPGVGSALYRYVFRKWDGTYLDDLDLVNVNFDKRILQAGSLTATIPIPSRRVANKVARVFARTPAELGIGPGAIMCEIYRGGEAWGEYWITGAKYGRSGNSVPSIQVRGSTLEAYLLQVELQETLGPFEGEDQIDIARAILTSLENQPYASLGLILQSGVSGVVRDRTYNADEGNYGQRLTELAQVDDGFEWMINVMSGPSGLQRHWVWGNPLGTQAPPPHVFTDGANGGDILEWAEEIDALRGATRWRARGDRIDGDASTTSTPLLSAPAEAAAYLAAGWPRIDKTVNHSSVTEMSTLESYAAYWAATAPGALRVDSVTVALGAMPSINPNSLGDTTRLHFSNEWHLPHWRTRRIIGIGITPTSKTDGKERAQLILEGQEVP